MTMRRRSRGWFAAIVVAFVCIAVLSVWRASVPPPASVAGGPAAEAATATAISAANPPVEREFVASAPEAATPVHDVAADEQRCIEVFGRVFAKATGAPIAGAEVREERGTSVLCDDTGHYEMSVALLGGRAALRASAVGFADCAEGVRSFEAQRVEVDFELSPIRVLTLQVVDRESGAPIADACIRRSQQGEPCARSAADGRFDITFADGRQPPLFVAAEGYCPLRWQCPNSAPSPPLTCLPLTRTARIEGRVTDANGQPLSSVAVNCSAPSGSSSGCWPLVDPAVTPVIGELADESIDIRAQTDAAGRFVLLVRPRAEPQSVVGRRADCAAGSAELLLTRPGETGHVELSLAAAGTIRGIVTLVGIARGHGYVFWRQGDAASGQDYVKSDGSYELRNVPVGRVELSLRLGFSTPVLRTATVAVAAGEVVEHDFAWQGYDGSIAGRVTTPAGVPMQRVIVRASDANGTEVSGATTDATGAYRIELPANGVYTVAPKRSAVRRSCVGVRPNATGIDFVLPELQRLRLRLVDAATRRPPHLIGFTGSAVSWRETGAASFESVQGEVDSTGLMLLEVAVGRVDLAFDFLREGYRPWRLLGLAVPGPDPTDEVRVELVPGVDLRLVVRGDTPFGPQDRKDHALFVLEDAQVPLVRGPVPPQEESSNARVEGVRLWLTESGLVYQVPKFDAAVRATLIGLTPGRYRLAAFPDDFVFEPATFVVDENGGDIELRWRHR